MIELDISTVACPRAILRLDECDAHLVNGVRWTPDRHGADLIYAHRQHREGPKGYLHRLIMQPWDGFVIDHIDRDGLNNCRSNLRVTTEAENRWNRRGYGASTFRGVYRKRAKWAAAIKVSGQRLWLGSYATEREAALAYDEAAIEAGLSPFGLNFQERKLSDAS